MLTEPGDRLVTGAEQLAVLAAGFGAGILTSTVGVASLLSFPVLVAVGLPPVVANASNTIGMTPAGLSGSFGYRRELREHPRIAFLVLGLCAAGSVAGAALLLALAAGGLRGRRPVADPGHQHPGRHPAAGDEGAAQATRRGRPRSRDDVAGHGRLGDPDRGVRRLLRRRLGSDDGGRAGVRARPRPAHRERVEDPGRDGRQRRGHRDLPVPRGARLAGDRPARGGLRGGRVRRCTHRSPAAFIGVPDADRGRRRDRLDPACSGDPGGGSTHPAGSADR